MERFRSLMAKVPTGLLSCVTVALILWLTLAPHPTGDLEIPLFPGADKVVHAIMFGFLTLVVLLESMKHRRWGAIPLPAVGAIAIACALFGLGIELLQHAMGLGRSFEVLDILADTSGAIAMGALWAMFQYLLVKRD